MGLLSYPTRVVGLAAVVAGKTPCPYAGAWCVGLLVHASSDMGDWRYQPPARGTITNNNRVMVKPEPAAPEVPYVGARVRLHHLASGLLVWQGISDAQGYYWPRGLEVGLWYYPVAIDLSGTHECDAAGPVQAVRAP